MENTYAPPTYPPVLACLESKSRVGGREAAWPPLACLSPSFSLVHDLLSSTNVPSQARASIPRKNLGLHFSKEPTHPRAWTMGRDAPLDGRQRPFFSTHACLLLCQCVRRRQGVYSVFFHPTTLSRSLPPPLSFSVLHFPLFAHTLLLAGLSLSSRVSDFFFKRATTTTTMSRPRFLLATRASRHSSAENNFLRCTSQRRRLLLAEL